jgi:hypothetical protein
MTKMQTQEVDSKQNIAGSNMGRTAGRLRVRTGTKVKSGRVEKQTREQEKHAGKTRRTGKKQTIDNG